MNKGFWIVIIFSLCIFIGSFFDSYSLEYIKINLINIIKNDCDFNPPIKSPELKFNINPVGIPIPKDDNENTENKEKANLIKTNDHENKFNEFVDKVSKNENYKLNINKISNSRRGSYLNNTQINIPNIPSKKPSGSNIIINENQNENQNIRKLVKIGNIIINKKPCFERSKL